MALLSMLLGCGNKISGPDFEQQENKIIVLNNDFRIDYEIPGNLSLFLNFSEKHKKSPKSISIDDINNIEYEKDDWKKANNLDVGIWEYYRGKRNIEKNIAAHLSASIDIIETNHPYSSLETSLGESYTLFLNGENGLNTETRKNYPDHSDSELGDWLVSFPTFNTTKINNTDYINWHIYGEISGRHVEYFAFPIDDKHFITIRFKYYFTAKNSNELENLETLISADIKQFMNQIKISHL